MNRLARTNCYLSLRADGLSRRICYPIRRWASSQSSTFYLEPQMNTPSSSLEPITIGGLTIRYLVDGASAKSMGMFELTIAPGSNVPPPHSHTLNEECVYSLEGLFRYSVDGVVRDLSPGEWMHSPKGSVHAFSNPHPQPARALIVLTPDLGLQYFRDVAAVVGGGGPPDRSKLIAVMSRYGLVPAPPAPIVAKPSMQADG